MINFNKKRKYNKTKFLGLFKIKTYGTVFFLFECDNNEILIQSISGEHLIFTDDEFVLKHFEKLGESKLLNILYGLTPKETIDDQEE